MEGRGEMVKNPKTSLYIYTNPVEDKYGLLLGVGAGPLFLEACFILCLPPEIDLRRQLP